MTPHVTELSYKQIMSLLSHITIFRTYQYMKCLGIIALHILHIDFQHTLHCCVGDPLWLADNNMHVYDICIDKDRVWLFCAVITITVSLQI